MGFALLSLKNLNVPMYSTLKRLTPCVVLMGKWRITGRQPAQDIIASVMITVSGCVVAGLGDFSFDFNG